MTSQIKPQPCRGRGHILFLYKFIQTYLYCLIMENLWSKNFCTLSFKSKEIMPQTLRLKNKLLPKGKKKSLQPQTSSQQWSIPEARGSCLQRYARECDFRILCPAKLSLRYKNDIYPQTSGTQETQHPHNFVQKDYSNISVQLVQQYNQT